MGGGLRQKASEKMRTGEIVKTLKLDKVKFLHPNGEPLPQWQLFVGPEGYGAARAAFIADGGNPWQTINHSVEGPFKYLNKSSREEGLVKTWKMADDPSKWLEIEEYVAEFVFDSVISYGQGIAREEVRRGFYGDDFVVMWDLQDEAATAAERTANHAAATAALDAVLYAQTAIWFPESLVSSHAKARWEVWQKGYCLLGDLNGVLYVYAYDYSACR